MDLGLKHAFLIPYKSNPQPLILILQEPWDCGKMEHGCPAMAE